MDVTPSRRMSHSLAPPPPRRGDYASLGQLMGWMLLLGLAAWPRLFILGFWLFDHQFRDAFSGWIIPLVGFFVLPWTTLAYAFMWGATANVVSGWEWIVVAVGFLTDIVFWLGSRRALRG